ncbi:MAG TPA: hypothetical protein VGI39_35305, partial [Polyangiaceae bacterium]
MIPAPPLPSAGIPAHARLDAARKKLQRGALLLLALLAPLAVLALGDRWGSRPALDFVSGTIAGPTQVARSITLPYSNDQQPDAAKYAYELEFSARAASRTALRIIPDDCVRSFEINGASVPLTEIRAGSVCDFHSGFDIEVGRFLRAGGNHLRLEVENTSGRHGLAVYSIRDADPVTARSLVFLLLAMLACFLPVRALRIPLWQRLVAAVLLGAGGWIRYQFVFNWHPPESFVYSDMGGYVERASQLLAGGGNEGQAFQPLGYSMVLALSLRLVGDFTLAVWAHVVLGWATVALVWRASARWLRSDVSLAVLALAALHVPFISLSGFFLAETVFTFQLALLIYGLARFSFPWKAWQAFALGLVYMSALWFKGNNTLFGPLVVAWVALWVLSHRRAQWRALTRRVLPPMVAFCAAAALVVASHAAFTYLRYGHAHLSAST